jgi:peptidoglycan/LPS O-acetylase OafA/YrhL
MTVRHDEGARVRSDNRAYMPAVDHLRFLAATLVVVFHGAHMLRHGITPDDAEPPWIYTTNPLETFITEGHTGVALFLVLSGFILTTGSLGRQIQYGAFMRNRLLRVMPLYLILLIIAMVVAWRDFSLIGALQTTLGFARAPGGFHTGPFAQVLWTIGVELQFYLVFPLFLRLLNTRGPRPLMLFILCMAVLRVLSALTAPGGLDYNQLTYFSIVGRIDQFLIGMLAAYFFPQIRRIVGKVWVTAVAVLVVGAALWVFNQLHGYTEPGLFRTVWVDVEGLVWAGVLVSYVGTARFARGRLSALLAAGGERSYGLYLLHMPLIHLVASRHWQLDVPGGVVFDSVATALVLVLPGAIVLASLTYAAVEQPFLSLRSRYVNLAAVPSPPGPSLGISPATASSGTGSPPIQRSAARRGGRPDSADATDARVVVSP